MSFSEHSLQRAPSAGGGSLPEASMARIAATVSATCCRNSGVCLLIVNGDLNPRKTGGEADF